MRMIQNLEEFEICKGLLTCVSFTLIMALFLYFVFDYWLEQKLLVIRALANFTFPYEMH